MKKILMLIPIVLLITVDKGLAQKKDSVTLLIDYFDGKTGNKYGFTKKFDHVPRSNDSIIFKRECLAELHKITDSLRKQETKNSVKRKKTN